MTVLKKNLRILLIHRIMNLERRGYILHTLEFHVSGEVPSSREVLKTVETLPDGPPERLRVAGRSRVAVISHQK